uniref:Rap guanine nucleotide exchange factor (GEF) 3 n=1 Tax=Neogobius melanostomus TaxID=47308 RepID=A0A8C6WND9_9GOBI
KYLKNDQINMCVYCERRLECNFTGSGTSTAHRVVKAARAVYSMIVEKSRGLIRDRKHHLKTHRQCCSGKELVDWLMKQNECLQSRSQAVGMWQVLVEEGILTHVKQELNFLDKDTQFYRFQESDFGLNHVTNEKVTEEDLQEALSLLSQLGPDALLTMILRKSPSQRSAEDLEVIYEELLHVKAAAHLSTSVRKELAAVLVFESHAKAGTVLFSQGDKGTSWYIIWKGSVNVITHGKGLVTTLHEGEDFGQLALLNDAPRAATIILREDNCHFLRVDKHDFIRILKDVEANTVRLEEHGKTVLVLEKSAESTEPGAGNFFSNFSLIVTRRYTVMSGTPEKILEHLLDTLKLDSSHDATDLCVSDFVLTHKVFMPSSQLCPFREAKQCYLKDLITKGLSIILNTMITYGATLSDGSEQEKAAYILNKKQKVVKLVGQWVAVYGLMLKEDPIAVDFLEVHRFVSHIGSRLKPVGRLQPITAKDKVLYEIYEPDHKPLTVMLPVNSSVQDVMSAILKSESDHALVKMNSVGERAQLKLDSSAVFTALGLNERLFICTSGQVEQLRPLKGQLGPDQGTADVLEQMSSKDIANELLSYDWELFTAMHEVELVYYVFGRHKFHGAITANLERCVRRFNEVQHWVVTELCLCEDLVKRAILLKKFIKIAAVLKEQRNLNSFFAVMFGLTNSAVQRLHKTWERIPNKIKRVYCQYERLMNPSRNHRAYRLAGIRITLINWSTLRRWSQPYDSEHAHPLRTPSNIRHYILNLKVIDNQRRLTQLSRTLES